MKELQYKRLRKAATKIGLKKSEVTALLNDAKRLRDSHLKVTGLKIEYELYCDRDNEDITLSTFYRTAIKRYYNLLGVNGRDDNTAPSGYPTGMTYDRYKYFEGISFINVFYDGTVDTEVTTTANIESDYRSALYLPVFNECMRYAAQELTGTLDTTNAGLHIATITGAGAAYPFTDYDFSYKRKSRANMARNAQALLPALLFVGSADGIARGFGYRNPSVSEDKYNFVHELRNGYEWRVFETCYNRHGAITEYIGIVANIIDKYFRTDKVTGPALQIAINNGMKYAFIDRHAAGGAPIALHFRNSTAMDILKAGLSDVKPEHVTLYQLKKDRRYRLDKKQLIEVEREAKQKAEMAYKRYIQREVESAMLESSRALVQQWLQDKEKMQKIADKKAISARLAHEITEQASEKIKQLVDSQLANVTPQPEYIQQATKTELESRFNTVFTRGA